MHFLVMLQIVAHVISNEKKYQFILNVSMIEMSSICSSQECFIVMWERKVDWQEMSVLQARLNCCSDCKLSDGLMFAIFSP